jgi:D-arabinan exo alpha-(1,3)/(1,5)-arabinofuranosidase (non-reducing end)
MAMGGFLGNYFIEGLPFFRNYHSRRFSSWDKTGGNRDWISIESGETVEIAKMEGAGCVKHIWITVNCKDVNYPRTTVLRMYWDDEESPSVEVPLGDFFGVGHAKVSHFHSLPLNMVTGGLNEKNNKAAMNCFFPMPYHKNARITVTNDSGEPIESFYYYIDYEEHPYISKEMGHFHANWRRENPTRGYYAYDLSPEELFVNKKNLTGLNNYVLLDAAGKGHYVGCVVSIDNVMGSNGCHTWFGEGDDMIFIDGEDFPPTLHGTGTEDYFCAAWGFPSGKSDGLFHGISLAGDMENWMGKWSVYRFHLESPIVFQESIRVTIEHGHDNNRADDWSSVAYWYQGEPHKTFDPLLPVKARLPRP